MRLYCFWFIVLFVPTAVVRGWFTKGFLVGILSILRGFLFGSTFIASWYITASVIAVLIVVMCSGRMPEWSLCLLSLCCYVLAVSSSNYGNLFASWPEITALANRLFPIFGVPYNNFVVALFWVSLGRLLAVHQSALGLADDTKEGDGVVGWAIVAAFVVGAALLFLEQRLIDEFALAYANDCYLCLPLPAAALVLITLRKRCSLQFAKVLRSASTVTYCLHGTLVSVLRYVATRAFPQFLDDQRILLFVVTLLICWVAAAVVLKLEESPKLHFLKYSH